MAKINISIADELLERADAFAESNYMTRSGLLSFSLSQFLNQAEVASAFKSLAFSMRKISDMGEIDEKTKKDLDDFVKMADVMFNTSNPTFK